MHAFIGEEFNDVPLFSFHDFDTFCLMDLFLPAKFARWPISTIVPFAYRNRGCSDHFLVMHFVNGWLWKKIRVNIEHPVPKVNENQIKVRKEGIAFPNQR
jgi:hypothetical protein